MATISSMAGQVMMLFTEKAGIASSTAEMATISSMEIIVVIS